MNRHLKGRSRLAWSREGATKWRPPGVVGVPAGPVTGEPGLPRVARPGPAQATAGPPSTRAHLASRALAERRSVAMRCAFRRSVAAHDRRALPRPAVPHWREAAPREVARGTAVRARARPSRLEPVPPPLALGGFRTAGRSGGEGTGRAEMLGTRGVSGAPSGVCPPGPSWAAATAGGEATGRCGRGVPVARGWAGARGPRSGSASAERSRASLGTGIDRSRGLASRSSGFPRAVMSWTWGFPSPGVGDRGSAVSAGAA